MTKENCLSTEAVQPILATVIFTDNPTSIAQKDESLEPKPQGLFGLARNVEAAAALGVVLSYGRFDLVVVAWQLCQYRHTSQMLEVVHPMFANASPVHALKWVEWQGFGVVVCRASSQAMNDIIPPWVHGVQIGYYACGYKSKVPRA